MTRKRTSVATDLATEVAADLAARTELVRPVAPLKQLPIIETSIVALEIPAPYDFIQGRRTTDLPPSLMSGFQQAQAALKATTNVQQEQAQIAALRARNAAAQAILNPVAVEGETVAVDPEARAAADAELAQVKQALVTINESIEAKQLAQIEATMRVYDLLARILNATIIEWNLVEYARTDGPAFNAPGSITRDDLLGMRESMLQAISGAVMGNRKGDADRKKDSTAS